MIKSIIFWLNCARVYSLPITVLNWLVIFLYSLTVGGKVFYGILALLGISLVHMSTNLIDDYFDYKILVKDKKFLDSAQNCKCAYLKNGQATVKELRNAIIIFLAFAGLIGGFLFFKSGVYVALLAFIGLLIALTYQKFSLNGFGEVAVIIAYGPLMYEGVYYVMTGKFSWLVCLLSLASALFTNTILYAHMLMDYDGDECAHKTTLCRKLKTKDNALKFILFFYISAYLLILYLSLSTKNYYYFLTLITLPGVMDLYNSLKSYNKDKNIIPKLHYIPADWEKVKDSKDAFFYFNFFYARDILSAFLLLTCFAIIFDTGFLTLLRNINFF